MLKAGIFLDVENLMRNGGWGMKYDVVRDLVAAQGAVVLRANAYMAVDNEREQHDEIYRQRIEGYRNAVRRAGFHLSLKEVTRYSDYEGKIVEKADADVDLAVDAVLQTEQLDYVMLGTGDGDFLRLVRALQTRGKRVDLLSFDNTSRKLRQEVDHYYHGLLIPGLVPDRIGEERRRGIMYAVVEDKAYGFISTRTGLGDDDFIDNIFVHMNDTNIKNLNYFSQLRVRETVLEFDLQELEDGRLKAFNVVEYNYRAAR